MKKSTALVPTKRDFRLVEDLCDNCGKADALGAVWQDPRTGKRHVWCSKKKCEKAVKSKLPSYVADYHRMLPRKATICLGDLVNEIELSNDIRNGADKVTGRSARICHGAWANSILHTDANKIEKLFKLKPRSRFMIFNEDGELRTTFNKYREALKYAGKREVIVFWGGK